MNDSKKKILTRHDIEKNLKEIYKTAAVFNSVFIALWFCVLIFIFICQNKWTKDGSTLLLWQEILPLLPVPFICVRITCLISALKKFLNPLKLVKIKVDEFERNCGRKAYFNDLFFVFFRRHTEALKFVHNGFYYADYATIYYTWSKKWSMDSKELFRTIKPRDKVYVLVENGRIRYFYPDKMFEPDNELICLIDK